jgi:WD40 repeat protein
MMAAWILLWQGNDKDGKGIAVELRERSDSPGNAPVDHGTGEIKCELYPEPDSKDALHTSAQNSGEHAIKLLRKEKRLDQKRALTPRFELNEKVELEIQGRSADLLFALAVLKECWIPEIILEEKFEDRRLVPDFAATGELEEEKYGIVYVKGVDKVADKLRAALNVLPEEGYFFYPKANEDDIPQNLIQQAIDCKIQLCPVTKLAEAAEKLGIPITMIYLGKPYPGLSPIDYDQRSLFFGRQQDIKFVCDMLVSLDHSENPGLVIEAASGMGKSSFVRAGVIPALEERRQNTESLLFQFPIIWRAWLPSDAAKITGPGHNVTEKELVSAILTNWVKGSSIDLLSKLHGQDHSTLVELAGALKSLNISESHRFLWLIDQGEELFTSNFGSKDEKTSLLKKFIEFIRLLQEQKVWVVITLNKGFSQYYSGYLDDVFHPRHNFYTLARLLKPELFAIVQKPAELSGVSFEISRATGISLNDQLVSEAHDGGTASLPLLAYTLSELWNNCHEKAKSVMTYEAYQNMGGSLSQVIANQADKLYSELKLENDNALQRVVRALTCIVKNGTEFNIAEQTVPKNKFQENTPEQILIKEFIDKRFLVAEDKYVRVSHIALLTEWKKAQDIISTIEDDLKLIDSLRDKAKEWKEGKGELLDNWFLSQAEDLLVRWGEDDLNSHPDVDVVTFIEASTEAFNKRKRRQDREQKKKIRNLYIITGVFALLLILIGYFWHEEKNKAKELEEQKTIAVKKTVELEHKTEELVKQKEIADQKTEDAEKLKKIAENNEKKATAATETAKAAKNLAQEQAQEAKRQTIRAEQQTLEAEKRKNELSEALTRTNFIQGALGERPNETLAYLAKSIRTKKDQNSVDLAVSLLTSNKMLISNIFRHKGKVTATEFSPDGQWVLTASEDKTARVWDARSGLQVSGEPMQHPTAVRFAKFSPDGQRVLTISDDNTAYIWDARTGKQVFAMPHPSTIFHAAYSFDKKRIVTASMDGYVSLWDAITGKQVQSHKESERIADVGPDGQVLSIKNHDHFYYPNSFLRQPGKGTGLSENYGRSFNNNNPDSWWLFTLGDLFISKNVQSMLSIWYPSTGKTISAPLTFYEPVEYAKFSPDGQRILSVTNSGDASVYDIHKHMFLALNRPESNIEARNNFYGYDPRVDSTYFSHDGKKVISNFANGTFIWDVSTGQLEWSLPQQNYGHNWINQEDGKLIVLGSAGDTYTLLTGDKNIRYLETTFPLQSTVKSVEFSKFNQFAPYNYWQYILTVSDDKVVRVWNNFYNQKNQLVSESIPLPGEIEFAKFSPDGKRILVELSDNSIRVWDKIGSDQLMMQIPIPNNYSVHSDFHVAFSQDGQNIIASDGQEINAWNLYNGKNLFNNGQYTYHYLFMDKDFLSLDPDPSENYHEVGLLPKTCTLAGSISLDERYKKLAVEDIDFNYANERAKLAQSIYKSLIDCSPSYLCPGFGQESRSADPFSISQSSSGKAEANSSPDGKRVVISTFNEESLRDAYTGDLVSELRLNQGQDNTLLPWLTPDRHWAVISNYDGRNYFSVWNMCSGEKVSKDWEYKRSRGWNPDIWQNGRGKISAILSPNGQYLLAILGYIAVVFDVNTGQSRYEAIQHKDRITSATFSPDGQYILTASLDRSARIWDTRTGQPKFGELILHQDGIMSAIYSPNGERILTSSLDKTARVWDANTGQPVFGPMRHQDKITYGAFSPDGQHVLTTSEDNNVRIWDARNGKLVSVPMRHQGKILSVAFQPNTGNSLSAASAETSCHNWNSDYAAKPQVVRSTGTLAPLKQQLILTVSNDNTARVWSADGKSVSAPIRHRAAINSAEFSPDGRKIITASDDNTARIWDARTGEPISLPLLHPANVVSATFSPDGQKVLTISSDNTEKIIRVWGIASLTSPGKGFADFLEFVSGFHLNDEEGLTSVPIKSKPELRDWLSTTKDLNTDDRHLITWLLSDPMDRPITPNSQQTAKDRKEQIIKDKNRFTEKDIWD